MEELKGINLYAASYIMHILHSTSGPCAHSIEAIPWAVALIVALATGICL